MKVFSDAEIVLERCVGVFPYAEEMNLAADLLRPLAVIVRGERKRGVRLGGLPSPRDLSFGGEVAERPKATVC